MPRNPHKKRCRNPNRRNYAMRDQLLAKRKLAKPASRSQKQLTGI